MITLTILLFTILCTLVGGFLKLIFFIGGIFIELLAIVAIIGAIGIWGLGMFLLIDLIFLVGKIIF